MFQLIKRATLVVAAAVVVLSGPLALAAPLGGFEMGDFYRAKNETKGGDFTDPLSADPCDTVTLKMRLHNPGPSEVTNVNVKATVPSGTGSSFSSTATVTAADADPQTITDTVAINVSQATKINYVPGSTKLLDAHNGVISTLADGSIQNGVNIGTVGVSVEQKRFVQFSLKLDCITPPPAPSVTCDSLVAEFVGSTNVPAKVKFTAKGTASNGATINSYAFDFGDGAKQDSTSATTEHTYGKEGDFKATVQVKSSLGITPVSPSCSVAIKVTKDKPPVVTVTPVSTPAAPATLPSTGPAEIVTGLLGTSSLGYGIRQYLMSRRRISDTLNQ